MICVVNKSAIFSSGFDACFRLQGAVQSYLVYVTYEHQTHYLYFYFFWSGLRGPKSYSLWGGVVPSPSIGYEYL